MKLINIKDRKMLYTMLCLVLVCVFTLTIAYSALNAVLTISGNADVVASTWNIYLNNPKVKNGSSTTDVPIIKNKNSVEFSTTLNMPGDYYEFTVDVVNAGSIDAMIENVVKTPELTTEQAKFLKYEVSYQNGESIANKQLLAKETTMPIKVRIEYRNDLSASDLPTGQVVLDLSLTLEYIQSDENTFDVKYNGSIPISANGDVSDVGILVTIGSEQFYTIGTEGDNVKLFSMYNLYVGGVYNNNSWSAYGSEATGMQDLTMLGYVLGQSVRNGTTIFSDVDASYVGSIVEGYVNNYKVLLEENFGLDVVSARLITKEELIDEKINCNESKNSCSDALSFINNTSYWTQSTDNSKDIWYVLSNGSFYDGGISDDAFLGVRPVIVVSKDYF